MSLDCDVYLIHYKPLVERLSFMKEQLDGLGLKYEIISEEPDMSWYRDDIQLRLEKIKMFSGASYQSAVSWSNVSLAWKHLLAFEIIERKNNVGLVLEDDAILSSNFIDVISSILREKNWDVVFPGSGCNLRKQGSGLIRVPHPASKCTDAYLITPESAAKLHSTMKSGVDFAIDWELNHQMMQHDLKVFWHEPPVVRQGSQDGTWYSAINGKKENLYK